MPVDRDPTLMRERQLVAGAMRELDADRRAFATRVLRALVRVEALYGSDVAEAELERLILSLKGRRPIN